MPGVADTLHTPSRARSQACEIVFVDRDPVILDPDSYDSAALFRNAGQRLGVGNAKS